MADPLDIDLIIFDLDNTLFDYQDGFRCVIEYLSSPFNILYSKQDWIDIFHKNEKGYAERILFFSWLSDRFAFPISGPLLWDAFQSSFGRCINVNETTKKCLVECKAKYKIALLTNGSSKNQRYKIEHSGLDTYFTSSEIFISGELGLEKPNEDIFKFVCDKMKVQPKRTLSVGDHLDNDILAAQRGGLKTCWLCREETAEVEKDSKNNYDYRISKIDELSLILSDQG